MSEYMVIVNYTRVNGCRFDNCTFRSNIANRERNCRTNTLFFSFFRRENNFIRIKIIHFLQTFAACLNGYH